MSEFQPLAQPFWEEGHRGLDADLCRVWQGPIAAVHAAFDAAEATGFESEDRAARAFVAAMREEGLLERVLQADARSLCLARERVASWSGFADSQLALQGLGSEPLRLEGSAELRQRYLLPALRGEKIAAFALTEPEAGSDVGGIQTRATRDGDGYRLDGGKTLITNAGIADFYCVFAVQEEGLSAFVVEPGDPGFTVEERLRAMSPHPLGRLRFDGCRIPASRRIGAEGGGKKLAFATLERFRPSVGAAALGLARRALDESLRHAQSRMQFGRPIGDFQLSRASLAESWTEWEGARLAVLRAAWALDTAQDSASAASSMAKLAATEAGQRIVDRAVQLHGGRGVLVGSVVERLYRDIRALRIYEGTSEIQKLILGRCLLRPEPS